MDAVDSTDVVTRVVPNSEWATLSSAMLALDAEIFTELDFVVGGAELGRIGRDRNSIVVVAERADGHLIGCILYCALELVARLDCVKDDPALWHGDTVYGYTTGVAPAYRRHGLNLALMRAAMDESAARGYTRFVCHATRNARPMLEEHWDVTALAEIDDWYNTPATYYECAIPSARPATGVALLGRRLRTLASYRRRFELERLRHLGSLPARVARSRPRDA